MSEPKKKGGPKPNRKPKPPAKKDHRFFEEGLSEGQKTDLTKGLDVLFSQILARECVYPPSAIRSYRQMLRMTQTSQFMDWQSELLTRGPDDVHPMQDISSRLIQLERTRLTLIAAGGFLKRLETQMMMAIDDVKLTANAVFKAHEDDDLGVITIEDRDDNIWQIYTSAATPDTVVLRRDKRQKILKRRLKQNEFRAKTDSITHDDSEHFSPPFQKPKEK